MQLGLQLQSSLVLIKPDAFQRKLVGNILHLLEDLFVLERIEMRMMDEQLCQQHYLPHIGKDFYPELCDFMQSGPVLAVAVRGSDIQTIRNVCLSIRQIHMERGAPLSRNLIHSSDSRSEAQRELEIWFPCHPLNMLTGSLCDSIVALQELIQEFGDKMV